MDRYIHNNAGHGLIATEERAISAISQLIHRRQAKKDPAQESRFVI